MNVWFSFCAGSPEQQQVGIHVWGGGDQAGFGGFGVPISLAWHVGFVAQGVESEDNTERGICAVILSLLPLFMDQTLFIFIFICVYIKTLLPSLTLDPGNSQIPPRVLVIYWTQ